MFLPLAPGWQIVSDNPSIYFHKEKDLISATPVFDISYLPKTTKFLAEHNVPTHFATLENFCS